MALRAHGHPRQILMLKGAKRATLEMKAMRPLRIEQGRSSGGVRIDIGGARVNRTPPLICGARQPALVARAATKRADAPLLGFNVLEPRPASRAQAISRLFDAAQEPCDEFEAVVEPVLFRSEDDQNACRLA